MAQAFTHFTYEITEKRLLINNLSGFYDNINMKYLLKYSAIQTSINYENFGKYPGNILRTMNEHKCNRIC